MTNKSNEYTFPFDTCERPSKNGLFAQPYSVFFNCISIIITIYFLTKTKHYYSFALILVILIFQLFHQFSHVVHIEGKIQTYIIHSLAIVVNIFYLYALYKFTKVFPSNRFLLYAALVLAFDMYAVLNLPFVFYFFTQILLLSSTFIYYNRLMPSYYQKTLPYIIGSSFFVFLVFVNESLNCKYMLSVYPNFPFHAVTEVLGIIPFYLILSVFHRL
jgi:hypothetical protein